MLCNSIRRSFGANYKNYAKLNRASRSRKKRRSIRRSTLFCAESRFTPKVDKSPKSGWLKKSIVSDWCAWITYRENLTAYKRTVVNSKSVFALVGYKRWHSTNATRASISVKLVSPVRIVGISGVARGVGYRGTNLTCSPPMLSI